MIVAAAGLGTLYFMMISSRVVQQYFVCYFHLMHGPRIQLANGKSCRVPLRVGNAYYAPISYKYGDRRGKDWYIAMSIYCVDILKELNCNGYYNSKTKWEKEELHKQKKYKVPGGELDKGIVAATMC